MGESWTRVSFDFGALRGLTSPRRKLGLEAVGLGLIRLPRGEGYTFTHRHEQQEEVYIVVEGRGEMVIDDELIELARGDVVRVSAPARRALRATDSALLVICAGAVPMGYPRDPGARYLIDDGIPDYGDIPPWYRGDPEVAAKNAALAERMRRARERRQQEPPPGASPDAASSS